MSEILTQNADERFCNSCGKAINREAEICPKCGVRQKTDIASSRKDWLATLLFCFFLGSLGIHRFYTGHIGIGVVQLLTAGGCGVWSLIDFILILTNSFKDAAGNPLVKSWE